MPVVIDSSPLSGRESSSPAEPVIFLAEDNPADVYLIRQALIEHNIDLPLEVAATGRQALSFLKSRADQAAAKPALIVLDLNLPQHDGMEVLQEIRNHSCFAGVPVVILTSSDSPRDRLAATGLGATQYIRKPSSLEDFLAIGGTLKRLLSDAPEHQL